MNVRLGVDGGATKTECIAVDESGSVAARHTAPGCNPSVIGPEAAERIVREALQTLARGIPGGTPEFTLLCMAGSRRFWKEFAGGLDGFGRVVATDDSLPILELATGGRDGIVLHAGTGSFVAARKGKDIHYAGGLGWRFGDPGSAYDIGCRAIARALLELRGWEPASGLGSLVRHAAGQSDPDAISRHFYTCENANAEIAALCPAVLDLAKHDDKAAQAVAVGSCAELLALAQRVADKLFAGPPPRAGLSGPILNHAVISAALSAKSRFPLAPVESTPIEGVRRMLTRAGLNEAGCSL